MTSDPNWPINKFGVDMNLAIPAGIQTVGGVRVYQKSLVAQTAGDEGITDAPSDNIQYGRQNAAWTPVVINTDAGLLTGTTLAANVINSSLHTVGTLTGGGTGVGFTVSFANSTISGTLSIANGGTGAITAPTALSNLGAVPLAGGTMSGALILNTLIPVADGQAASKAYVDSLASGLSVKTSCVVATTANITLSGEQTIDGVLTSASRILVKNQTSQPTNGIYTTGAGAWTRVADLDIWSEVIGAFTFITGGSTQGATGWAAQVTAVGTIGSTDMPWTQYSASASYTASAPISLTGSVFGIADGAITNAKLAAPVSPAKGGTGQDFSGSTGLPQYTAGTASILSLGTNVGTFLTTPTSANLAAAVTNETGTGALVFGTNPVLTSPTASNLTNTGTLTAAAVTASGLLDGTTIRATSQTVPGSGAGVEVLYTSSVGYLTSYDRTGAVYKPLVVDGSTLSLNSNSGGNVGIGTTTPASQLDIGSGAPSSEVILRINGAGSGTNGPALSFAYGGTTLNSIGGYSAINGGAFNSTLTFYGPSGFIFQGGSVGIGTSTPTHTLDVVGTAAVSGTLTTPQITVAGSATPQIIFTPSSGATKSGQIYQTANTLAFADAGIATRMTMDIATGALTTGAITASGGITTSGAITSTGAITTSSNVVATGSLFGFNAYFLGGQPWADVRAWGAVGNGSTDDRAAIQNAIDYLASAYAGGFVFFPQGNYRISNTITVKTGVTLIGVSQHSCAITLDQIDAISVYFDTSCSDAGARDISIFGYFQPTAGQHCVFVDVNVPVHFMNCRIWGGNYAFATKGVDGSMYNVFPTGWGSNGGCVFSEGTNWYTRVKMDTTGQTTGFAFRQGTFAGGVAENHFNQCDFSGDFSYSVYIDDGGNNQAITVFEGSVFANPILINSARWTNFANAEIGSTSFAVNNTSGGHVTVANSYAFSGTTITGGSSNIHPSNNINIS